MSQFSAGHWLVVAFIAYFVWRILRSKSKPDPKQEAPSAAPVAAPNTNTQANNEDLWEGAFWEVVNPRPADITVHLLYRDAAGQQSKRTVNVTGFDSDEQGLIIGRCMLRNATRTFRYVRIERAIDPASGEVIDNLHAWLDEKYRNTPQGLAATLAAKHIDLFKVLLYIAKADGSMRTAEVQVIAESVAVITNNKSIDSTVIKAVLRQLDTPTLHGFKLAFGRLLTQDRAIAQKAWDTAKSIVGTQKTVHEAEQSALDYLEKSMTKTYGAAA